MNKINGLQLLGATVLLALVMIYLTVRTENRIDEAAAENSRTEQLGKSIQQMKSSWDDPAKTVQRIDRVLAAPAFRPYVEKKEKERSVYRVSIKNIPGGLLDQLTTKVLNEPVSVKQLQITRSSDQNASMTMEFSL